MNDLRNFEETLEELKSFLEMPILNDRDVAGIIQAFEFTFEQSWKAIQKVASSQGVDIANPKSAFSYAMQNKWIEAQDEQNWLSLLKDRNLTSHTYQEKLAKEVLGRIQLNYLTMFTNLLANLKVETT